MMLQTKSGETCDHRKEEAPGRRAVLSASSRHFWSSKDAVAKRFDGIIIRIMSTCCDNPCARWASRENREFRAICETKIKSLSGMHSPLGIKANAPKENL